MVYHNKISVARGIAIILMVIGHAGEFTPLHDVIYLFHMPLFFFFSGYCFKSKYLANKNALPYVKQKVKGLWWPYVKWGVLFLFFHNVFSKIGVYSELSSFRGVEFNLYYTTRDFARQFVNIIRLFTYEQLVGAFWFLSSLFWVSLILYGVLKVESLSPKTVCIWLLFIPITCVFFECFDLRIPYTRIDSRCMFGLYFAYMGFRFQSIHLNMRNCYKFGWSIISIVLLVVFSLLNSRAIDRPSQEQVSVLNTIYYLIVPFVGIYMILIFGGFLYKWKISRILSWLGNNTMYIIVFHFLSFKLVSIVMVLYYKLEWKSVGAFPIIESYNNYFWFILYSILGVVIPVLIFLAKEKIVTLLGDILHVKNKQTI